MKLHRQYGFDPYNRPCGMCPCFTRLSDRSVGCVHMPYHHQAMTKGCGHLGHPPGDPLPAISEGGAGCDEESATERATATWEEARAKSKV